MKKITKTRIIKQEGYTHKFIIIEKNFDFHKEISSVNITFVDTNSSGKSCSHWLDAKNFDKFIEELTAEENFED